MFKNMRIEIIDDEHLEEVCNVLNSMGCKLVYKTEMPAISVYITGDSETPTYDILHHNLAQSLELYKPVTLQDIIKMRDEMVNK